MCISEHFDGGMGGYGNVKFFNRNGQVRGGSEGNLLYIGVEIEKEYTGSYDSEESSAEMVQAVSDQFFSNSGDGSLDDGIEFQSMPATFAYHKKLARNGYYDSLFTAMNEAELESQSTCGSHVHISKAAMTELTFSKIAKLVHSVFSRRFYELIARRPANSWTVRLSGDRWERMAAGRDGGKYYAVNNQNGCPTYEFRMWDSPSNTRELMEQVEFVTAITRYVRPRNINSITQLGFRNYVASKASTYPNLARLIANFEPQTAAATTDVRGRELPAALQGGITVMSA